METGSFSFQSGVSSSSSSASRRRRRGWGRRSTGKEHVVLSHQKQFKLLDCQSHIPGPCPPPSPSRSSGWGCARPGRTKARQQPGEQKTKNVDVYCTLFSHFFLAERRSKNCEGCCGGGKGTLYLFLKTIYLMVSMTVSSIHFRVGSLHAIGCSTVFYQTSASWFHLGVGS